MKRTQKSIDLISKKFQNQIEFTNGNIEIIKVYWDSKVVYFKDLRKKHRTILYKNTKGYYFKPYGGTPVYISDSKRGGEAK